MKIKYVIVLLTILVLAIQPVSADFFKDVFDMITGGAIEPEEPALEPEPVPEVPPDVPEEPVVVEPELCPPIPINRWCPDRKTLCPMKTDEMGCSDWDCDACEPISEEKIICCKTWPVVPNPTYSYTWKAENECPPLQEGLPPVGEGYEIVSNEYCEEESKPPEPEPVPEVSPTEIVRICAAKIKITFDKEVYYYGDDFKLVVEIFDSQGNHIPYYSFYAQMYTYHNGMWHTPDEDKTAKDGYVINKGKIEEGKQALGKVKIKVYTSSTGAYADCDSVEDIIETEIRKGEKKEVCGIGVCVPEEVAEIKEIPEEKILYSCMGCELKGKCYPMGYRKEGKYCSDDYEFVAQIKDGECDNSFECKSNVCISGECVSESLLQKIINWFKRLSGIEPEPEPPKPEVDCSELLIEKDIGKYEYTKSGYGDTKESQAPLISDKGEQIGTIKCCLAQYLDQNEMRGMALVCPYKNNRDYVENLVKIGLKQAPGAEFILEDYKGEEVYVDKWISMVWVHENYAVAAGRDYQQEGSVFPEDIADAYLEKYPNDLG